MSSTKNSVSIKDIVLTGLFAAITLLGIQIFRIPLPAAIGSPFIHFGNSFAVLGILLLGGKKGAISASIGLGLFDIINGYGIYALSTVLSVLIVAAVTTFVFNLFKRNDKNIAVIAVSAAAAGLTNVVYDLVFNTIFSIAGGSQFGAAVIASLASISATVINSVSTAIIVTLLYVPLKKGLEVFESNKGVAKAQ